MRSSAEAIRRISATLKDVTPFRTLRYQVSELSSAFSRNSETDRPRSAIFARNLFIIFPPFRRLVSATAITVAHPLGLVKPENIVFEIFLLFIQNKCCISAYAVLLFIYRKGVTLLTTGERIKARRKELGISADQLASRIGVSRATMFRYENGAIEKVPSYVLALIASALNIDPVYLLLGYSDSSSQPSVTPRGTSTRSTRRTASDIIMTIRR